MRRSEKGDLVKRLMELLAHRLIHQSSAELCQCESLLSVINIQHHISNVCLGVNVQFSSGVKA